jgi:hypothetical protein
MPMNNISPSADMTGTAAQDVILFSINFAVNLYFLLVITFEPSFFFVSNPVSSTLKIKPLK